MQRLRASADRYAGVGMETAAFASGRSCSRSRRYRRGRGGVVSLRKARCGADAGQSRNAGRASQGAAAGGGELAVGGDGEGGAGGEEIDFFCLSVAAG
jgi:hypothetical protein